MSILRFETRSDAGPNLTESKVFVTFHLIGGLGNLAMLVTALVSKRINRHTTWLNFCITWIIFALSYTLLLYFGRQFSDEEPAFPLCLTQASLIYGAPPLAACSTLSLVMQTWLSLRTVNNSLDEKHHQRRREPLEWTIFLLALPYIVWLAVIIGALTVGLKDPSQVQRAASSVYCSISTGVPGHVVAGIVAVIMVIAIIFEAIVAISLYRFWGAYTKLRQLNQMSLSISMVVRIGCFLVLNIVAVSQTAVFLTRNFLISNIWISLTPVAAVAVFGTQRDLLKVLTFRKSP